MNKQTGSSHVAIVAVAVVVLIGILGFVFWQSMMKNDEMGGGSSSSSNSSSSEPTKVDTAAYSFTAPAGFAKSNDQLFKADGYTAVESFKNDNGDYFEVLESTSGGQGLKADIFKGFTQGASGLEISDSFEKCGAGDPTCPTGDSKGVSGVMAEQSGSNPYYLAFGNIEKEDTDFSFVKDFTSTFIFK